MVYKRRVKREHLARDKKSVVVVIVGMVCCVAVRVTDGTHGALVANGTQEKSEW